MEQSCMERSGWVAVKGLIIGTGTWWIGTHGSIREIHWGAHKDDECPRQDQTFPLLPIFTGEEVDREDRWFVKWHENFEEHAALAGWDTEQKLHQLKFHWHYVCLKCCLSLRVRFMHQRTRLKKRFRLINIEELKGLKFDKNRKLGRVLNNWALI